MTHHDLLKRMYWQQQSGRYNPIIRDGLVAWEPLDRPRATTMVGGYELTGSVFEYIVRDGVPCRHGGGGVVIPVEQPKPCTISQWNWACGANYVFCGYYVSSSNAAFISNQSDVNRLYLSITGTSKQIAYPPETWRHLVICIGATSVAIYVDGELRHSKNVSTLKNTSLGLTTGTLDSSVYVLGAGFRFYNRVLTQEEITALSHEFTPTP